METNTLQSKAVDHLGLVSGMYDELGIEGRINELVKQNPRCRELSIGTICKALVLNGLGFTQRTLYLVSSFFEGKPVEELLGKGVQASQLNDSVLGRALDDIYAYGTTELFSALVPGICQALSLSPRFAHMDSTDFHLDGAYNAEQEPDPQGKILHLTKGYSRDHRPDLNQVVLNLIADNQAGIPLHMEALDGNSSDKTSFRQTIGEHIGQLQNASGFEYLVMDSAGYTAETLSQHSGQVKWISRVPESIKACKEALLSDEPLQPLDEKHLYRVLQSDYADIAQRWILVWSEEAYNRELKTLRKKYLSGSQKEAKALLSLCRETFSCQDDAEKALLAFEKKCAYIAIEHKNFHSTAKYLGKGRPAKDRVADHYVYQIQACASCPLAAYTAQEHKKGKFIIATNELDSQKLSDREVLMGYKGQAKVERGFRFLKDPQFVAASFFVKKPQRVEALLFIMTLCLTLYAALEYKLRQKLEQEQQSLPNQLGKPVRNPTTRWVFALFAGIHFLYSAQDQPICLNLNSIHTQVLDLLGQPYKKYYLRL